MEVKSRAGEARADAEHTTLYMRPYYTHYNLVFLKNPSELTLDFLDFA